MIKRDIIEYLKEIVAFFPVVVVTGPRQSGKTTLLKEVFPDHEYFNLEMPSMRDLIANDMAGFLKLHGNKIIIDEVQRLPELLSYIQASVDENRTSGRFLLSGSQNVLLSEKTTQSLAGRAAYLELLPLSQSELAGEGIIFENVYSAIYKGSYPEIYKQDVPPRLYYDQYVSTYVERDLKQISNIGNLDTFRRFMRIAAGRIGNVLDYTSIANDVGVSVGTVRNWLSILSASYITYILPPYYNNFGKRYIKMPKLYFIDTGLACRLLGIHSAKELEVHSSIGALFENYCVTELLKQDKNFNKGIELYFFRDTNKNEVDLIVSAGDRLTPIEIKSSSTFTPGFLKGIKYWNSLPGARDSERNEGYLFYTGDSVKTSDVELVPYNNIFKVFST
jgi:predicted AAA+ superfamily ATPase